MYDIPYLMGRIDRLMGEKFAKRMSPWGICRRNEITIQGRPNIVYDLAGISVIDYLDLYKKYSSNSLIKRVSDWIILP